VTQEELKDWIKFTQTRYIMNDVHSQWDSHKLHDHEKLSWTLYRKDTYGFMTGKYHKIIFILNVHIVIKNIFCFRRRSKRSAKK